MGPAAATELGWRGGAGGSSVRARNRLGQVVFAGDSGFHRTHVAQSLAPIGCQIDQLLGLFHIAVIWVPVLSHEQSTVSTLGGCASPAPYEGAG